MLNNFFLSAPPAAAFQSLEQNLSAGPVCPPGLQAAEIRSCSAERGFHSGRKETQPLSRARRLQRPRFFCASFAQSTSFWLAPSLAAAAQKGSEGMCACVYQAELGARRRTPQSGDCFPWAPQELVPSSRARRRKAPLAKGPDERQQKAAEVAPPTRRGLTLRQVGGLARECNPSPPKQPLVPETGLKK